MQSEIIIIDFGMGNLFSIKKKIDGLGFKGIITNDPNIISNAKKLILPGVGHFKKATEQLKKTGIWDILNKRVLEDKIPILGICLGLHLMAQFSEEGNTKGLGIFDTDVKRFSNEVKVPQMGWNNRRIVPCV